ncbi:hypothetical protein QR98_0082520 [Sarcoptes scabiei]|uniref:Uncharacterized protein n=1 Tax=Sarcoptes scabiei TaxID=52283 RepID=A0A132AFE3_SARSC|nr:hypothetical protein QR98_0082520 [Sarcoptes scabiei]
MFPDPDGSAFHNTGDLDTDVKDADDMMDHIRSLKEEADIEIERNNDRLVNLSDSGKFGDLLNEIDTQGPSKKENEINDKSSCSEDQGSEDGVSQSDEFSDGSIYDKHCARSIEREFRRIGKILYEDVHDQLREMYSIIPINRHARFTTLLLPILSTRHDFKSYKAAVDLLSVARDLKQITSDIKEIRDQTIDSAAALRSASNQITQNSVETCKVMREHRNFIKDLVSHDPYKKRELNGESVLRKIYKENTDELIRFLNRNGIYEIVIKKIVDLDNPNRENIKEIMILELRFNE